jgi:5-methylcytosine-specific restriction enzyme subunit McrC
MGQYSSEGHVMSGSRPELIRLEEYVPAYYPPAKIPHAIGEMLYRNYRAQVTVDFPSPKTDDQWRLIAQGWVGYIPLTPELGFALEPKVELSNIFRMLEYAYRLKSFRFLEGLIGCQSLKEFYEELASILSHRVLDRGRKGFYRAYLPEAERLPYVRGRLEVRQLVQTPWDVKLQCHYEEHTSDIEENQILAWTLWHVARSGMCTERVLPTVRQAYRALQGFVTLVPFSPQACIGRLYNRLNQDYQPLHALSRFFLEHSGPSHEIGDRTMLPFLVNMERLFELFVAEWLKVRLPKDLELKAQEKVDIDRTSTLHFDIDLVLYDATGTARCVLDTKYKTPSAPAPSDIAQAMAYAEVKGCREAVLVYPASLDKPLDQHIGNIHVRSLTFSLDGDLEFAGQAFVRSLLAA